MKNKKLNRNPKDWDNPLEILKRGKIKVVDLSDETKNNIKNLLQMEKELEKSIRRHEDNLIRYTEERNYRNKEIQFMKEHNFEREAQYLILQKEFISGMYDDYKEVIGILKELSLKLTINI